MDHRDIASHIHKWYRNLDENKMTVLVELYNEDIECDEEVEIHFIYEVCETCNGKGMHVNPSIDSNGITGDEWNEWDEEERVDYMSGIYDVECYECEGLRVVPIPDINKIPKGLLDKINSFIDGLYYSAVEQTHELEMGY